MLVLLEITYCDFYFSDEIKNKESSFNQKSNVGLPFRILIISGKIHLEYVVNKV